MKPNSTNLAYPKFLPVLQFRTLSQNVDSEIHRSYTHNQCHSVLQINIVRKVHPCLNSNHLKGNVSL